MKLIEINKERKNNKNTTKKASLEETLELIKPNKKEKRNKNMNGKMLLHSAHHPKDIYINKLQEISNTTCKHKFKERLKIDKFMITYHNPDNLRKIVLPSSSKECD